MRTRWDAAVVGGGPAGLQAALTLGRMHVSTVWFDDGVYRNATSAQMHNVPGADGWTPAGHRAVVRDEVTRYPHVTAVPARVVTVTRRDDGFIARTDREERRVGRLLIASGVNDRLLPIPGLRELWGDVVLPCPYCHGHEYSGGPIVVISDGSHAAHVGALLRGLGTTVPVLAPGAVDRVERTDAGVLVHGTDGRTVAGTCVFVPSNPTPRLDAVAGLGLEVRDGGVVVDALGRTGTPGVWAAGDVARRLDPRIPAAVVTAMAQGLAAAADIAADVAAERETGGRDER